MTVVTMEREPILGDTHESEIATIGIVTASEAPTQDPARLAEMEAAIEEWYDSMNNWTGGSFT